MAQTTTLVSTMPEIDIGMMKSLIKHVGVGLRQTLMFWGRFGIGKTQAVTQVAWSYYLRKHPKAKVTGGKPPNLVDIRLSQYESVDFRGLPDRQNDMTVWNLPATIPYKGNPNFVEDDQPIFLFLDEFNSGTDEVQAVAYQLTDEQRVGEHILMDNVIIICAGNREMDRGITHRMSKPLCNRLLHFEVVFNLDNFIDYMIAAGHDEIAVSFFRYRRELLEAYNPEVDSKVFVTPRTAEKALICLSTDMPSHVKRSAVAGAIGVGPATELFAYMNLAGGLPDIDDIIANPKSVAVPTDLGMCYAVTMMVSGAMSLENAEALHTYLQRLAPEFQVTAWTAATRRDETLYQSKAWLTFSKDHKQALIST